MKKSKFLFLLLLCIVMMTVSCKKYDIGNEVRYIDFDREIRFIMPDYKTIKGTYKHTENKQEEQDKQLSGNNRHRVNEIKLYGDTDILWEVNEESVIYNGLRVDGLLESLNNVETPCSKNVLTRFIVETFSDTNSENIICTCETYEKEVLKNSLNRYYNYNKISEQYNDDVCWIIKIIDIDNNIGATLYGCKSFIVGLDLKKDISIEYNRTGGEHDYEIEDDSNTDIDGVDNINDSM